MIPTMMPSTGMISTHEGIKPIKKNNPVTIAIMKLLPNNKPVVSVFCWNTMKMSTHVTIRNKPASHPSLAVFTPSTIWNKPVVLSMKERL